MLIFTDNCEPANTNAIDLRKIIKRAAQQGADNLRLNELISQVSQVKTIEDFASLVIRNDDLGLCHTPMFTKKFAQGRDVYIPIMVQTGDTGEAIIRDADFQHFSIHSLAPTLGFKSFNGAT